LTTSFCPKDFDFAWVAVDTVNEHRNNSHFGSLPSGEFFSFSTVLYHCCRNDGPTTKPINLPNTSEFILAPTMKNKGECQQVNGMTATKTELFYDTVSDNYFSNSAPSEETGSPPPNYWLDVQVGSWGSGLHINYCHYKPNSQAAPKPPKPPAPEPDAPICWPDTDFGVLQPAEGCPREQSWHVGFVNHWLLGNSKIDGKNVKGEIKGQATVLGYCNHHADDQREHQRECTKENTAVWQPGSYCIIQGRIPSTSIFEEACPEGFWWSWYVVDDVNKENKNTHNGSVPEGEYYNFVTLHYLCCRDDGGIENPINLPNTRPFNLYPTNTDRKCQAVAGMDSTYGEVFYDQPDEDADFPKSPGNLTFDYTIDKPKSIWGQGLRVKVCSYKPKAATATKSKSIKF